MKTPYGERVTSSTLKPAASYMEIGRELGLSPESVRQIENRALNKLRLQLLAKGLTKAFREDLR